MSGPVRQLTRVLKRSAQGAGCGVVLTHERERPWITMTFAGARHTFRAEAEPAALLRWVAMLPEADLPLGGGWFVASCSAEVTGRVAVIELLVLED